MSCLIAVTIYYEAHILTRLTIQISRKTGSDRPISLNIMDSSLAIEICAKTELHSKQGIYIFILLGPIHL